MKLVEWGPSVKPVGNAGGWIGPWSTGCKPILLFWPLTNGVSGYYISAIQPMAPGPRGPDTSVRGCYGWWYYCNAKKGRKKAHFVLQYFEAAWAVRTQGKQKEGPS